MIKKLDELEKIIKEELKGYHFTIDFLPEGGLIDVQGCDECGTGGAVSSSMLWGPTRDSKTLSECVDNLKLGLKYEKHY